MTKKKGERWNDKKTVLVEGEWDSPIHRGWKLACCDCHLVHIVDFRIRTDKRGRPGVELRMRRDERATAAMRRPFKFSKED